MDARTATETGTAFRFDEPDFIAEIAPRLYKVKVPLPNNPLRSINSYFLLGNETTTVVDVGFDHPACEAALSTALARLGRSWESVEILLTHSHPDHTGNLDRIYRDGMRVFANLHSFQEVQNFQDMQGLVSRPLVRQAARPLDEGLSFDEREPGIKVSAELLPLKHRPAVSYLKEGDEFAAAGYTFQIIETPGHDNWHICLYDPASRMMLVGDHVLERITPSVSSWVLTYNALQKFMRSLGKVSRYDVDLVLPAHGEPFRGLAERCLFLKGHEEIYDLVGSGYRDIVAISSHAKWKYPNWREWTLDQKYFSMAETMAHLIYLVCDGKVKQTVCGDEYRFELP